VAQVAGRADAAEGAGIVKRAPSSRITPRRPFGGAVRRGRVPAAPQSGYRVVGLARFVLHRTAGRAQRRARVGRWLVRAIPSRLSGGLSGLGRRRAIERLKGVAWHVLVKARSHGAIGRVGRALGARALGCGDLDLRPGLTSVRPLRDGMGPRLSGSWTPSPGSRTQPNSRHPARGRPMRVDRARHGVCRRFFRPQPADVRQGRRVWSRPASARMDCVIECSSAGGW